MPGKNTLFKSTLQAPLELSWTQRLYLNPEVALKQQVSSKIKNCKGPLVLLKTSISAAVSTVKAKEG